MPKDSGFNGQLISLAGLIGRPGAGLSSVLTRGQLTGGVVTVALSNNPGRVWAVITNDDKADYMSFALGENPTSPTHDLFPGGSFTIDRDTPWTGDVRIISANDPYYSVTEVSIEGW